MPARAFYMGVELAHAELAWRLGKRYVQDQPLDWGVAVEREARTSTPGVRRERPRPAPERRG